MTPAVVALLQDADRLAALMRMGKANAVQTEELRARLWRRWEGLTDAEREAVREATRPGAA